MLTLSNFLSQYITLALGALVGWAVSRLWRIGCVALFYFSYTPQPSWEQSQNNVFIVNSRSALDGCFDSLMILKRRSDAYRKLYGKARSRSSIRGGRATPYSKAKYVILGAAAIAFTSIGLKLATPALLALIPVSRLGLVVPKECGGPLPPSSGQNLNLAVEAAIKTFRWANAAFSVIDRVRSADFSDSPLGTKRIILPQLNTSFSNNTCPLSDPSACHPKRPFTFTSQYTLSSEHFGFNVRQPFSLEVLESCYRPYSTDNITEGVLRYGPDIDEDGTSQDWTYLINMGQTVAGSYLLQTGQPTHNSTFGWQPYANLTQGGDTTLLVYYTGGVVSFNASYDPIFANKYVRNINGFEDYEAESAIVPIICDTKYVFCEGNERTKECSEPGGSQTLADWLARRKSELLSDIQLFFTMGLTTPPIYHAALGPSAVLAAQSIYNAVQASTEISALGELSRLSRAGMILTASAAQLSVNGYLNMNLAVTSFKTPDHPESLCNHVIMESSTVVTIPVLPYALIASFSILIVAISYSVSFDATRNMLFSSFRRHHDIWTLHLPGQLHKGITERLNGKDFKPVDIDAHWPNAPFASGPVVVTSNGVKKFGSGEPRSLNGVLEISNEYLLTEPLDTSEHNYKP